MADRSDSTIRIDTKFDTSNFVKGAEEIEKRAEDIKKTIEEIGEKVTDIFGDKGEKEIDKSLREIVKKFNKAKEQFSVSDGSVTKESLAESEQAYENLVEQARAFQEIANSDDETANQMFEQMTETLALFAEQLEEARERLYEFRQEQTDASRMVVPVEDSDSEGFERGSERMSTAISSMQEKFEAFEQQVREAVNGVFRELVEQCGKAGQEFLDDKGKTEEATRKTQEFTGAVNESKEALEARNQEAAKEPYSSGYENEIKSIEEAPRLSEIAEQKVLETFSNIANSAGSAMAQIASAIADPGDAIDRAFYSIANAGMQSAQYLREVAGNAILNGLSRLGSSAKSAALNLSGMVKNTIINGLRDIASNAASAAKNIASMAKGSIIGAFNKLKSSVNGLSHGFKGNNINVKRSFMTVLRYAFGIRSVFQAVRKLRSAMTEGLNNVMQYDAGFKQTVDDFKSSLETLKNAVGAAIAPIAQMVLPVITRIIDAITEGVNKFGMLVAAITGQQTYTKATKAQTQAYKDNTKAAKENQKTIAGFDDLTILNDNSDQNNDAANDGQTPAGFETAPIEDGIKGIADALKKMWEEADFTDLGRAIGERLRDALNSIPWDAIKEVARKLGKSLATLLNGFLEVPGLFEAIGRTIAEALNTLFEFLNAFVTNFHWDSLGRAIKDGILGFLNNIDWPLIFDTLAKAGAGIATTLNEIFRDPELPVAIGQAIANLFNAIFTFLYNFVSTFDFAALGNFIKNGLISMLDGIDWELIKNTLYLAGKGLADTLGAIFDGKDLPTKLGKAIANIFNTIVGFIYGFVSTFPWASFGAFIKNGLLSMINSVDWGLLKATMAASGKGIADALAAIFNDPELPVKLGNALAEVFNSIVLFIYNLVSNMPWTGIGDFIKNGLLSMLNSVDWLLVYSTVREAGLGIGQTIEHALDDPALWQAIFTTFSNAVRALFTFVYDAISTPDWGSIGQNIGYGLNEGVETFPWNLVSETIAGAVNALFDLMFNIVSTFDFYAFGEKIGQSISDTIGGINWEEGAAILGTAVTGLFDFLRGIVDETDWGALAQAVLDAWSGFFGSFQWDSVSGFLSGLVVGLFTFLSGLFEGIDWVALPGQVIAKIGEFFDGVNWGEVLAATFRLLGDAFMAAVGLLIGVGGAINKAGEDMMNGLLSGIWNIVVGIGTWIKEHIFDPIVDGIKKIFGIGTDSESGSTEMQPIGTGVISGFLKGILSGFPNPFKWLKEHVGSPVVDGVKTLFGVGTGTPALKGSGTSLIEGLKTGMSGVMSGIKGWIKKNVADPVENHVKSGLGTDRKPVTTDDGQKVAEGLKSGMSNVMGGISSFIKNYVANPVTNAIRSDLGTNGTPVTKEDGQKVAEGLKDGISNGMSGVDRFVSDTIASPITGGVQNSFGISGNEARVFTEYGRATMDSFERGMSAGIPNLTQSLKNLVETMMGFLSNLDWKPFGEKVTEGLKTGIESGSSSVMETLTNLIKEMTEALQNVDWKPLGERLTEGIKSGIEGSSSTLVDKLTTLAGEMVDCFTNIEWGPVGTRIVDGIKSSVEEGKNTLTDTMKDVAGDMYDSFNGFDWGNIGGDAISAIKSNIEYGSSDLDSVMRDIAGDMYDAFNGNDWEGVGNNISVGIYNGIVYYYDDLLNLMRDMGYNMLQALKNEMGIASPSKEFYWLAQMMTLGMVNGLEDTTVDAVDAVTSIADAVTEEAKNASPELRIQAGMEGSLKSVDETMSQFADKIVGGFEAMIASLQEIAMQTGGLVPRVATGSIMPYATGTGPAVGRGTPDTDAMMQFMALQNSDRLTREDLREVLTAIAREYFNFDLYLGDEQVARSANRGNLRLNRRYNPVSG